MSANADKGKILSLDDYRKQRAALSSAPPAFDPTLVAQRINRARLSPSPEERELAVSMVLNDAETMLRTLGVMGGEIGAYRQQIRSLAQQVADTSTIISVLLANAGGTVEVPLDWFVAYEVPENGGYAVEENPVRKVVVIRAIVDERPAESVGSVSADQQTGGTDGAD